MTPVEVVFQRPDGRKNNKIGGGWLTMRVVLGLREGDGVGGGDEMGLGAVRVEKSEGSFHRQGRGNVF